jgi:hypothetical protein
MSACIDIVIVNWNAGSQLAQTVQSIEQFHGDLVRSVVVVDNDSSDDSLERLESLTHSAAFELKIVRNDTNLGFGAACNQGAAICHSPFILFLNPDTRLFSDSLSVPAAYMQQPENSQVGITGIQLIDETGEISRSCSRFPSVKTWLATAVGLSKLPHFRGLDILMTDWSHTQTREVDHVIGAFYLMRRRVFEQLGGFDDRFFVYLEDLDLSYRAHRLGYASVYLTDAQAFHAGGGTSKQIKATRLYYSLRSRLIYTFIHHAKLQAWLVLLVTLTIEPVSRSLFALAGGGAGFLNTWRAYIRLYKALPDILRRCNRP